MIVHITLEIEADEKLKDVPNLVAKALAARWDFAGHQRLSW
ncbi:hypothetical protein SAMN05660489_06372 [Pseudomonas sp. LAMO17WK12:I10]|nr:hypothetical protein H160_06390 [Pseudomonas sp. LAMO17WK12:I9]SNY54108.1 hypothetical protein SAMN05660489_06372 [Pseudomonas sp. LAMO17WK12:I10]